LLKLLAISRKHTVLYGSYLNFNSAVTIFCTVHKKTFQTTYNKYKKSKFGCSYCARAKQSQAVAKANSLRKK